MSLLPARVPTSALYEFTSLFVPLNVPQGTIVELTITTSDAGLSIRGFGAYLSLADRVYGRMTEAGLRTYARRPYRHLRIDEVRQGSLELVIKEVISHSREATPLAVLWMFLKYLKPISEATKNFSDAYKVWDEVSTKRQRRKQIKASLKLDQSLAKLDQNRLTQLATLIDDLLEKEERLLPAATRFAQEEVKSVELNIKPTDVSEASEE